MLFKDPSVNKTAQIEVELRAGHLGKRVAQLRGNEKEFGVDGIEVADYLLLAVEYSWESDALFVRLHAAG